MKNIKSITSRKFDILAEDSNPDLKEMPCKKLNYSELDKSGNTVKDIKYDEFEEVEEIIENVYNDKGNLIEEKIFLNEDEFSERKTYKIDENGRIATEFIHYLDESIDTVSYEYDAEGNLIKKVLTDSDGVVESKEILKYKNGKEISYVFYNEDDELVTERISGYDTSGNLLRIIYHNSEEDEKYRIENTYNDDNRLVKTHKFNENDDLIEKLSYKHNDKGRVIEAITENQNKNNIITFKYNDNGNAIEQKEMNIDETLNHYIEREFDENGNVLKIIVFINGSDTMPDMNYILEYEYEFYSE